MIHDALDSTGCPNLDLLAAYSLGKLAAIRLEAVANHISTCPGCESLLPELPPLEDDFVASLRRWGPVSSESLLDGGHSLLVLPKQVEIPSPVPMNRGVNPGNPLPFGIGKFQFLALIGRGGMGIVYQAKDTQLNRVVALKMIRDGLFASSEELARFRCEVETAARLEHPHIIRIYEYGEEKGEPYYAMELMAGSLDRHLSRGPLPEREAAELVVKLARAIAFAHGKGVIHRDLKPANILLAEDGTPKISDFGLAKLLNEDRGQTSNDAVYGTAAYMAPEQARGESKVVGPAADVYGLGAILYETLTGQVPFKGGSRLETLEWVRSRPPEPLRRLIPSLSPVLDAICRKCLHKDPRQRYASAQALADDLGCWLRKEPTQARPPGAAARARTFVCQRWAVFAAVLLVAVVAVGLWWLDPDRSARLMESQLARGEVVKLIGDTGPPIWSRWRVGGAKAQATVGPDGVFTVHGWDVALLELVREPRQQRFRFRTEIRHERNDPNGSVGLFFCHGQISFLESELHSFFTLSFDDINEVDDFLGHLPPNLPVHAPGTNPVSLLIRHYSTGKDNKSWDRILGGPKPKLFRPVDFAGGDVWRTLTIEVNGDRVCGYWGNERMPTGEILLGRASDRAERDLEKYQAFRDVNPVPKGIAWFPVGGSIGFYVCRGSASFRRTMIEPLIEGTGD